MIKDFSKVIPLGTAAFALLLATAPGAYANPTIFLEVGPQYGESNPYQYKDGGEFTALTHGLSGPLQSGLPAGSQVPVGYSSLAEYTVGGVTGFETFCVENQVDFYVGSTYNFTEGTAIQQAGSKGVLTAGVAWLYQQFATGTLSGYNYTNAGARLTDAGELQATIWYLEGEPVDPNFPTSPSFTPATDPFTTLVLSHFGSLSNAEAAAGSSYGVKVLELTDNSGNVAQDQLIYTNVPDNGTTVLLLGIAFGALAAVKWRTRKHS